MSSPFKLMLFFCLCCFFSPEHARITVNETELYAAEPDGYVIVTVYNDALPRAGDVWTFSYATIDVRAKAGLDYTATSMVNQAVVSPQRSFDIVVNITNDDVKEYRERFLLKLTAFSQGDPDITVTIHIFDDRFGLYPVFGGNRREGTLDAYINLYVEYGIGDNVTINTVDKTATAGEDYEAITERRVTLSLGDNILTVHIINDTLMEPPETFLVQINGSSLTKNLTLTVSIEDDDHPVNSDCNRLGEYCLNGGSVCNPLGNVCWCFDPYTGPNCAINSDHIQGGPGCGSLDCVHGTCMSNGTLATCACDRNYIGDLCDKESYFHECNPNNISICLSPPQNMQYVTDVYVTGYRNTADCNLTLAPTQPDPSDGIVDWCEGYAGVFDYNTTCGEVDFITEGGLSISVLRLNITFDRVWGDSRGFLFAEEVTFRCPNNYGMEVEDEPCCQPDPGMEHAVNMSQANRISMECLLPLL